MERRRADSIWTEGNPGMRTANNNFEDLLDGVSGSGPPSVGGVWSQRGGDVGLGYACSYASMGVYVHLCELYVSNSL